MAAIVQIDQPVTTIGVQAGQHQSIGFDIVNIAGRTLYVVATTIVGDGGAAPAWLTVDGERTLRLQPNETRKVTLGLAPPATAPAGKLAIRLKVYEVSLPEENNGFSEAVTVTVTPARVEAPKRPWKLMAAIAAVLALVIAGGGWLAYAWLTPDVMPALVGKTQEEALAALDEAGVDGAAVTILDPVSREADGKVTAQSPDADTELRNGVAVSLTIPRQPVMPDVTGRELIEALSMLREVGIDPAGIAIEQPAGGAPADIVIDQSPDSGQATEPGVPVQVVAPRPPGAFALPELPSPWARRDEVAAFYAEQGVEVEMVVDQTAPGRYPGEVTEVLPPPGTLIGPNTQVRVTVLSDEIMAPWLAGRFITDPEVEELMQNFDVVRRIRSNEAGPEGCITSQQPEGMLRRGSRVVMNVADGSMPTEECVGGRG